MSLPLACAKPCNDCPWRRNAAPGWLGPLDADDWISVAMSDEPVACHQTIHSININGEGDWTDPTIRQCTGAAIFRRNIFKSPRNPDDAAHSAAADALSIFATPDEFKAYHQAAPGRVCLVCRHQAAEWNCTACDEDFCDSCIDASMGECPDCGVDPGWVSVDAELDEYEWAE